ncbi:MAG: hypothetical protein KatS3mg108_3771 [Isosphaeraceae bacterium]|jgi:hypothetical protein|nr:MAG: hypothetical protein KatS3mg108_3771 [Isosphaeraceae bacterium]
MSSIDATLIVLALLCLGLYAMIAWLIRLAAGVLPGRYAAYRQLAQRYDGRCEARGLVDPPTVRFTHNDRLVRVGLAPRVPEQPDIPRTRVVVRFPHGLPIRLELYPRRRPTPPQPPRGTRPIRLEQPEFDHTYAVHANDADITQTLLGPESVRSALEQLRALCPPAGMLLSINPERLLIQVDRDLGTRFSALEAMTRIALSLSEQLQSSVAARLSEGIHVLADPPPEPSADPPACPICGDQILGPHVACNTCRTPTHSECWKYAGRCPTYGCPEKTASPVRPQPAAQAPSHQPPQSPAG